jgi:3-deoxy-7-phosphoheptulonate synthase
VDDKRIYNINVLSQDILLTPEQLKACLPMTARAQTTVLEGRTAIEHILDLDDHCLER